MIKKCIALIILFLYSICNTHLFGIPSYFLGKKHEFSDFSKVIAYNFFTYVYTELLDSPIYSNNFKLKQTKNKIDVVICNHIATFDWLLAYCILNHYNIENLNIVIMRSTILNPICYGVAIGKDLKISRKWKDDELSIEQQLDKIDSGMVIIFPEGRRFTKKRHKEAMEFSIKNKYPIYANTLVPRTKGLWKILSILNRKGKMGKLFDLTFYIPSKFKQEFYIEEMLNTDIGRTYCYIRDIKVPTFVLEDKSNFKNWFFDEWKVKNKIIDDMGKFKMKKMKFEYRTSTIYAIVFTIAIYIYLLYNIGFIYFPIFVLISYFIIYLECYWNK